MAAGEKKIIVTDIDGTLVDRRTRLPDSSARAVLEARRAGHLVYACTGRSKAELYPYILDLGFDGLILGNGSYVEHGGEMVRDQSLPKGVVDRALTWLQENGLAFYLESNLGLYASSDLFLRTGRVLAEKEGYSDSIEDNRKWAEKALRPRPQDEPAPLDT